MIPRVPKSSASAAGRTLAALPAVTLAAYGLAFAAAGLGRTVPAYDDHPGQLQRLWHVVTLGAAPWAWDPAWWTGYPELQFYPPAFAYAGALLPWMSFGAVSVPDAYLALLWLAYLAPGFTTLFALTNSPSKSKKFRNPQRARFFQWTLCLFQRCWLHQFNLSPSRALHWLTCLSSTTTASCAKRAVKPPLSSDIAPPP